MIRGLLLIGVMHRLGAAGVGRGLEVVFGASMRGLGLKIGPFRRRGMAGGADPRYNRDLPEVHQ